MTIPEELQPALQAALRELADSDDFRLVAQCDRNSCDRVGLALARDVETIIVDLIGPYVFDGGPVINWFNAICADPGGHRRPRIDALCEALGTEIARTWRAENGLCDTVSV